MKSNQANDGANDGAGIRSVLIEIAKQWSDSSFRMQKWLARDGWNPLKTERNILIQS